MELDSVKNKIIRSKPFGLSIVKGAEGSGKTTTAMYRILHLKNNYCLYDEDGILLVTCGKEDSITFRDHYNKTEEENKFDYISLFSSTRENLQIYNISDIVYKYFLEYKIVNHLQFSVIQDINIKENFLRECLAEFKITHKNIKVLNES